mmetsp:Transcript_7846/g.20747  ORF Transcript_7846/g.20747 Transcript_7846/m.20747 type:complete len:477 (-) Transcript_7846:746-2176(-)
MNKETRLGSCPEHDVSVVQRDSVEIVRHALRRVQAVVQESEQLKWLMSSAKDVRVRPTRLARAVGYRSIYTRETSQAGSTSAGREARSNSSSSSSQGSTGSELEHFVSTSLMIPMEPSGSDVLLYVYTDSPARPSWSRMMSPSLLQMNPAVLRPTSQNTLELIAFSHLGDGRGGLIVSVSEFSSESMLSHLRMELIHDASIVTTSAFPATLSRLEILRMTEPYSAELQDVYRWDSAVTDDYDHKALHMRPEQTWALFHTMLKNANSVNAEAVYVSNVKIPSTATAEEFSITGELLDVDALDLVLRRSQLTAARADQPVVAGSACGCEEYCDDITLQLDAMLSINRVESWILANKDLQHSMQFCVISNAASSFTPSSYDHGDEWRLYCKFCNQRFRRHHDARRHEREKHNQMKLRRCPDCPREFSRESNLRRHRFAVHERKRIHACEHCGTCFSTRGNLERHVARLHGDDRSKQSTV